jgi:Ca2+-binding EF-hand superfamily protein
MRFSERSLPLILLLALAVPTVPVNASPQAATPKAPKAEDKASPQEDKNPYLQRFRELDRNKSGYVERDEWPLEPKSFDVVDRDQDGRLSQAELMTPNRQNEDRLQRQFNWLDTNRDGRLSQAEMQKGGTDLRALDRNKDGALTRGEFQSQVQIIENTWRVQTTPRAQSQFTFYDRNRDNRVNRLEWPGARALFLRLDRNRDGFLSPNEWPGR